MDALSPFTRRFVAIGLLLVALVSSVNLIVVPGWQLLEGSLARLGDSRFQRRQIEAIVARPAPPAPAAPTGLFLVASDPQGAMAALTARVHAVASGPDLRLVGINPGSPNPRTSNQVGLTIAVEGREVPLVRMIDDLERGRPLIRLAQWRIVRGATPDTLRLDGRVLAAWGRS